MLGGGSTNLAKILLKEPRRNQFETDIATQVNKHLALELYFTVVGTFILKGEPSEMNVNEEQKGEPIIVRPPSTNELIKDV